MEKMHLITMVNKQAYMKRRMFGNLCVLCLKMNENFVNKHQKTQKMATMFSSRKNATRRFISHKYLSKSTTK